MSINMEFAGDVSVNELLADILIQSHDEDLRSGFTKGYYISQIQRAVEDLGYDIFFQTITRDFKMDKKKLILKMPNGSFNIREIYLFNGDCCSKDGSVIVHWKRLFNNLPGGTTHTAKRKENNTGQTDPIFDPFIRDFAFIPPTNLYYANIQNGTIMFSSNCADFDNIRLVYNGVGTEDIGDEPVIPRIIREAVIDFVLESIFRAKYAKDRTFRAQWSDAYNKYHNPVDGSKIRAERRVKKLGSWKREGLKESQSRSALW